MTKTRLYLLVTFLSLGLAATTAFAGKPDGKGGGNKGGPQVNGVPTIAVFDLETTSDILYDNGNPIYIDHEVEPDGGEFVLMGSGNLRIDSGAVRELKFRLRLADRADSPDGPVLNQEAYDAFVDAYWDPNGTDPPEPVLVPEDQHSINRHCLVGDLTKPDKDDYTCADRDASEGSIRDMQYYEHTDDHSGDLLLRFAPAFLTPASLPGQHRMWCGTDDRLVELRGERPWDNNSYFMAHCDAPVSSSDTTCAEWRIVPYFHGAVDLSKPVADSNPNICTLVRTLTIGKGKQAETTVTPVADFDFRFGFTLYRDANDDGCADVLESGGGCVPVP